MQNLPITTVQFPDTRLSTRDGHKLRGYFGNAFREHSPLLHNHFDDGTLRHDYPLVQYKIVDNIATLIGLGEGAELLRDLFLQVDSIHIDELQIPVYSKNIFYREEVFGPTNQLHQYQFKTLWLALNQKNYQEYQSTGDTQRQELLNRILVGNILVFFRAFGLMIDERLMAMPRVLERTTMFKDQKMRAFQGEFVANAILPNFIGLGKSVSRGFGCIANTTAQADRSRSLSSSESFSTSIAGNVTAPGNMPEPIFRHSKPNEDT